MQNNSTIDAEINGSSIDLTADVSVIASDTKKWSTGAIGYFMKSTDGGNTYTKLSSNYSITISGGPGVLLSGIYTYTDSAVSDQNTYKYFFEIEAYEEPAGVQQ